MNSIYCKHAYFYFFQIQISYRPIKLTKDNQKSLQYALKHMKKEVKNKLFQTGNKIGQKHAIITRICKETIEKTWKNKWDQTGKKIGQKRGKK